MSLGILKINEKKVLSLTDPVALFQFLKEVARHTYDIEALFQVRTRHIECGETFILLSLIHDRQRL